MTAIWPPAQSWQTFRDGRRCCPPISPTMPTTAGLIARIMALLDDARWPSAARLGARGRAGWGM